MACGLLLFGLLIGVLAGCQTNDQPPSQKTDTLSSPNPENSGWFGRSVAAVGDLNGDGNRIELTGNLADADLPVRLSKDEWK